MSELLIDAGPMVALIDRADPHHAACARTLERSSRSTLVTTWPAVTEAMYFLGKHIGLEAQDALWELLNVVRVASIDSEQDRSRMRALMQQYGDHPMDLADASLVYVAERESIRTVFTIDRDDFETYRIARKPPAKAASFRIVP